MDFKSSDATAQQLLREAKNIAGTKNLPLSVKEGVIKALHEFYQEYLNRGLVPLFIRVKPNPEGKETK